MLSPPVSADTKADISELAEGNNPTLCSDQKGECFAAFEAKSKGSKVKDILFSKSTDAARNWSAPVNVSKTAGKAGHPAIAFEKNGAIDLAWSDCASSQKTSAIFFARSADGGKVWSKPMEISNTTGVCSSPALAISPDNSLNVVWKDTSSGETHPDIFYTVSNDAGKNWSKAKDISNTPGVSSDPCIAVSEDAVVHVAWLDTTPGVKRPDIFYNWASNGSWNKPINVSNSPRFSAHPSLACGAGGKVFVAWSDNSIKEHAADIWCAVSQKAGEFSQARNLSDSPGVSSEPMIVADNFGRVAAVWSDTSNNGVQNIFASMSFDALTKVSSAMDLTDSKFISKQPCVSLGSDNMVLVWEQVDGDKSTVKAMSKGFPHH